MTDAESFAATYVDCYEAARLIGANPDVVKRYLREGRLPGFRVGVKWIVRREDLVGFDKPGLGSPPTVPDTTVLAIRAKAEGGVRSSAIAKEYGISPQHVRSIVRGTSRREVA